MLDIIENYQNKKVIVIFFWNIKIGGKKIMSKKQMTDFKNDVLFKYTYGQPNQDSQFLLSSIISSLTGIECCQLTVINPVLSPHHMQDKDMILDIKAVDTLGKQYDIEMQNSSLNQSHHIRFQMYGAKMLTSQLSKGEDYSKVKNVYQIIFVDDIDKDDLRLIDIYTSKNQDGKEERYHLTTRIFVYLPYINEIAKKKSIMGFNDLEIAIYVFKNGMSDDIMKIQSRVIEIMKKKIEEFNKDEELIDMAFQRHLNHMAHESEKKEMYNQGKEEGKIEGKIEGKKEGQVMTQKQNVIKMFHKLYPNEDDTFLQNLTYEQYGTLFDMLLEGQPISKLKSYIHN